MQKTKSNKPFHALCVEYFSTGQVKMVTPGRTEEHVHIQKGKHDKHNSMSPKKGR